MPTNEIIVSIPFVTFIFVHLFAHIGYGFRNLSKTSHNLISRRRSRIINLAQCFLGHPMAYIFNVILTGSGLLMENWLWKIPGLIAGLTGILLLLIGSISKLIDPWEFDHEPEEKKVNKLPRTWGRELRLLWQKENREQIWTEGRMFEKLIISAAIVVLPNLLILGVFVFHDIAISDTDLTISVISIFLIAITAGITVFLFYLYKCFQVLRPIYFQRKAEEKGEDRDSKFDDFKEQLPEDDYRYPAFPRPKDAKQFRIFLDADHPLSPEQHTKGEALHKALEEAEAAEEHAALATSQSHPS